VNPDLWSLDSWKSKTPYQIPVYPDPQSLHSVVSQLGTLPPLVFGGEVYNLRELLGQVTQGKAFIIQGGDCAESFAEFNEDMIRDTFRVFLQMGVILSFVGEKKVIKIGRCAGQFAKPRSADYEIIDGESLPSYRGDIINSSIPKRAERLPDPSRMLTAYYQSTATLNFLRALSAGGFADTKHAPNWILDFVENKTIKQKYEDLAKLIQKRFDFMEKYRIGTAQRGRIDFFTSHEALLLPYEQALTRLDHTTREYVATSGHFLWIGDRTRQLDGAHVEFLRGVANPIGIKCGPSTRSNDLQDLLQILNPLQIPGRITLVSRMGVGKVTEFLPGLINAVRRSGHPVVWMCDPMHGNTEKTASGVKFRSVDKIFAEIQEFFEVCYFEGVYPGGLHLEMTGKNVTECTGGPREIDLTKRYETYCDPRLNDEQALDLCFKVCELFKPGDFFS
jgi:3-deoxy-7-phosphoheptulonate synthase